MAENGSIKVDGHTHYSYIKVRSGSIRRSRSKEERIIQLAPQAHDLFRRQSVEIVEDETCALFKVSQ